MAQYLLEQTAMDRKIDVVLISDPLSNPGPWVFGSGRSTAIWVTGVNGLGRFEDGDRADVDFTTVRLGDYTIVSVYLSPSTSLDVYSSKLDTIMNYVREQKALGRKIILGGDFNAHAPVWDSKNLNSRGAILLEELLKAGIHPIKPEGGPTFERAAGQSFIDFVAVSDFTRTTAYSRVLETKTASDHRKKKFPAEVETYTEDTGERKKWLRQSPLREIIWNLTCIWWNPELTRLRSRSRNLKRQIQRGRKKEKRRVSTDEDREANGNNEEVEILKILYKEAVNTLKKKIIEAKVDKWSKLCEDINIDVWGKPYKIIMKSVSKFSPPANLSPDFAKEVLEGLFPRRNFQGDQTGQSTGGNQREEADEERTETEDILQHDFERIHEEEVREAAKKITPRKAAGLDGISAEIIKTLAEHRPDSFAALFNGILRRGRIPDKWKTARTILLRKPGKGPDLVSAYRPICIIDAIAKLLEYLLKERLTNFYGVHLYEKNQFGFTKGRSTVHAMMEVRKAVRRGIERQKFSTMVALDIKNAFNSLRKHY
ncbi:uncharacterized protein LOC143219702 [Lasioglossum baleicum]|uniref:uncharacterized protein LOC143219702 n=1 Tax=Lasioglossum baleicum TaxID=434251 RepID=UPI003FCDA883